MTSTEVPTIGLGTMGLDGSAGIETVRTAIELGYRHLDTAQIYDNENVVGNGIERASVDRDSLFVATKVWADSLEPAAVRRTAAESAERLGVETIDLLYVHRPIETYDPEQTLPAFEALQEAGTIDHIGVSNFTLAELNTARDILSGDIFAHQIELHPLFYTPELIEHAATHDYYVVAYSPLAGGAVFDIPELTAIAEKHETSEAAVSIAWLAGKDNVLVIPKASSEPHLRANLEAAQLRLDPEDIGAIESIDRERELYPE